VVIQFWEWSIPRDTEGGSVGLCGTEHRAMEALSKALVAAGRPARGQVGQVTLVRPINKDPLYVREEPERTAVYDGSVIRWL
jgi:hypothetical protein